MVGKLPHYRSSRLFTKFCLLPVSVMDGERSIVEYFAEHERYRCGYCGSSDTNYSHGRYFMTKYSNLMCLSLNFLYRRLFLILLVNSVQVCGLFIFINRRDALTDMSYFWFTHFLCHRLPFGRSGACSVSL